MSYVGADPIEEPIEDPMDDIEDVSAAAGVAAIAGADVIWDVAARSGPGRLKYQFVCT